MFGTPMRSLGFLARNFGLKSWERATKSRAIPGGSSANSGPQNDSLNGFFCVNVHDPASIFENLSRKQLPSKPAFCSAPARRAAYTRSRIYQFLLE